MLFAAEVDAVGSAAVPAGKVTWGIFITRKYWQINDEEGEEIPAMLHWSTSLMINGAVCSSEAAQLHRL